MKFRGWDWTEMLRLWPETKKIKWPESTPLNLFADEEAQATFIREKIASLQLAEFNKKLTNKEKLKVQNIRNFVMTVAGHKRHTSYPLYRGLAKIKDDETFLKYTAILLEGLWT